MDILKIRTYKFEELGKEAKEQAIEEYRENHEVKLEWWNDMVKDELEEKGFTDIALYYSLGYCQGDVLCFSAFIDLEKFLRKHKLYSKYKGLVDKVGYFIKKETHHYAHVNTCETYWEEQDGLTNKEIDKAIELCNAIEEIRIKLCKKYEGDGYKEIEHQQSEEYIEEQFRLGEYTFTKWGSRCVHLW